MNRLSEECYVLYEDFVQHHPNGHLFQSTCWSRVKECWESEYLLAKDEKTGRIKGTVCVRIRKLPGLPFTYLYASRGPVCDWHDAQTLADLTGQIRALAKKRHAIEFMMDTPAHEEDRQYRSILEGLGYRIRGGYAELEGIQPRLVRQIDLRDKTEEQLLAEFSPKHRYNTRLATRRGVRVREGTVEDVPEFYRLMEITGKRDGFHVREQAYYEHLLRTLGPEHGRLLLAYEGDVCTAGIIGGLYAGLGLYLYGASDHHYRKNMPTYLLQWEMMRWCLQKGAHTYDLLGVACQEDVQSELYGLYRFKKGFGGQTVPLIGEIEMVFHPMLQRCFNYFLRKRKQWLHRHAKQPADAGQ